MTATQGYWRLVHEPTIMSHISVSIVCSHNIFLPLKIGSIFLSSMVFLVESDKQSNELFVLGFAYLKCSMKIYLVLLVLVSAT